MKRTLPATLLLTAWLAVLAALGWHVQRSLIVGTDLRLFMPNPATPQERLLLEEIGEGPGSRLLIVAIQGAPAAALAEASRALVDALRESASFRFITNGEVSLDDVPEELLPYRFLLSPTLDTRPLDLDHLHRELTARARDLASPGGDFLEPLLPRDPTLELLALLQSWQPVHEPNRQFDVWFDDTATRALLLAETQAPAFDPDRQQLAIDELRAAFARLDATPSAQLTVSGAGAFSALMKERTRNEAATRGTLASVALIVLLLAIYRRAGSILAGALPLASAALAGLFAVSSLFGTVHGITLAFGFTLIGVALDYPIHVLSHERTGRSALDTVRALWPTLATGVLSTCIAYFAFVFSGVTGLAQLACFTVAGLAAAGLTTRFLLPHILATGTRDHGDSPLLARLWGRIQVLPRPRWFMPLVAAASLVVVARAPWPMWENDLRKLTPVPAALLAQDTQLRAQLGTPDLRYLLAIEAQDTEQALARLEALDRRLLTLREQGAIAGYEHAARYLPSVEVQLARQKQLPEPAILRATLERALADTPFRPGVFEPFVLDVERARALPPLTAESLGDSPLAATLDMLLRHREGGAVAFVTFTGVADMDALHTLAAQSGDDVVLIDLRTASETLVARQRTRILWTLGGAAGLLVLTVSFALRRRTRVLRTLAPVALSTLILLALLHGAGVSLTLFHLVALILAAGLGLDYALFFERATGDPAEQRRTLHAVIVCACSTLLVFALLATSSLPVLQAIGLTVALGVILNFALAALLIRPNRNTFFGTAQAHDAH